MNLLEILLVIGVIVGLALLVLMLRGVEMGLLYFSVFGLYIVVVLLYAVINQALMSKTIENSEGNNQSANNNNTDEYTYAIMPAGDPMSAEEAREWLDDFLVKQQSREDKK